LQLDTGACRTSCPVGAISLVFGTAKRGIEHFRYYLPDFERRTSQVSSWQGEAGRAWVSSGNALVQGTEGHRRHCAPAGSGARAWLMVSDRWCRGPRVFAASLHSRWSPGTEVRLPWEQEVAGRLRVSIPRAPKTRHDPRRLKSRSSASLKITQNLQGKSCWSSGRTLNARPALPSGTGRRVGEHHSPRRVGFPDSHQ